MEFSVAAKSCRRKSAGGARRILQIDEFVGASGKQSAP